MSKDFQLHVAAGTKAQPEAEAEPQSQKPKSEKKTDKPEGPKPKKALPTVRIAFSKQLDLLRAYAVASGPTARMVNLKDVANIVQMSANTIPLANPFFVDVKFVQRSEGQGTTPATELLEYAHAYEWDKETAAHKLSPLLSRTWFWDALQPRLAFQELGEDQAVTLLAEKASAGPSYKSQLRLILDYLEAAGMVKRENGMVRMIKGGAPVNAAPQPIPETESAPMPPPERIGGGTNATVTTNFNQKQGTLSFDISVRVDMTELAGWEPARIAALFAGVAQVVSAKGTFEKDSVKE